MSKTLPPIAPGAQIELRDVVWRVIRTDYTSNGKQAWRCVGVSELVRDQEALFLEELESSEVRVLDPRQTELVRDTSQKHQAGLLYIESLLRDVPPPDDTLPGGPREKTITYKAPWVSFDRERDYEVVWKHFAERFGHGDGG